MLLKVNFDQNKPIKPFAADYYCSDSKKCFNFSGVSHYDFGKNVTLIIK